MSYITTGGSILRSTRILSSLSAVLLAGVLTASSAAAATLFGVTADNRLITFGPSSPGSVGVVGVVTGLGLGEQLLGIDFRPATGQLYGLGSASRLYTITTTTGAATQAGMDGGFLLSGSSFGFDFNPTVDRIRVVSGSQQNLRLNPDTGALAAPPDSNLNPGMPNVVGVAYTNNFATATVTTLFGIDFETDTLIRIGGADSPPSPNLGMVTTIGALNYDVTSVVGFDILGTDIIASLNGDCQNSGREINEVGRLEFPGCS